MTKEDLLRCRGAAMAVRGVKRRIQELREDAQSISGVCYSSEPRGNGEPIPRQQRYVEALDQLSAEYEKTVSYWAHLAAEVEKAVRDLPPQMGELIRLRYVDGLKWEAVNSRLYISHMTAVRLHQRAMEKLLKA